MNAAVTRYRVMAYIVGVLLIVLVFVGIPLQVFAHQDVIVNYVGTTHGILYIVYLVAAYSLTRRLKLTLPQTFIVLLAGTIPVLTFIVERWVTRRFINPAMQAAGTAAARAAPQGARAIESSESTGAAQEA